MSDEVPFIEKICPLINERCVRDECVAYSEFYDKYYISRDAERLVVKHRKVGKNSDYLSYHILYGIATEKHNDHRASCSQYKLHSCIINVEETREPFCYTWKNYGGFKREIDGITLVIEKETERIVYDDGDGTWKESDT